MSNFAPRNDIAPWSRTPRTRMEVARPVFPDELAPLLVQRAELPHGVLAGGLRRSYSAVCINDGGALIEMAGFDRFIRFDRTSGLLGNTSRFLPASYARDQIRHPWRRHRQ
jgi:hypothetical protein